MTHVDDKLFQIPLNQQQAATAKSLSFHFVGQMICFRVKIRLNSSWNWCDHKRGQSPHPGLIFPHLKQRQHLSNRLKLCPTFSLPATQVSLNTSRLCPPTTFNLALLPAWNAWYVPRHTHPLQPRTTRHQQCEHRPGLVLMVFRH